MAKLRGDHGDGGDAGAHTGDSPGGRSASPADGAPHGVSAPTLDHSARTSDKAHKSHRKHKKHKKHCKHKKHKKSKKHGHKRHSASSHDSGDSTSNDDGDGGSVADPAATALAEHYQVRCLTFALSPPGGSRHAGSPIGTTCTAAAQRRARCLRLGFASRAGLKSAPRAAR